MEVIRQRVAICNESQAHVHARYGLMVLLVAETRVRGRKGGCIQSRDLKADDSFKVSPTPRA